MLSVDETTQRSIIDTIAKINDIDLTVRLLCCAPFGACTWRLVGSYGDLINVLYWKNVAPRWNRYTEPELIDIIDNLLEAKRPRAAFQCVHMDWPQVETSRLKRLLLAVATVDAEPAGHWKLDAYDISAALDALDGRTGVSSDEMAQLEFMYIDALSYQKHGIPNLERQIAQSPALFVWALALVFRRRDEGQDPPEWRIDDPDRHAGMALAAHRLLERISSVPGSGPDGLVNTEALMTWVTEVRRLCSEHGRVEVGDQMIGQLLSKAAAEVDGTWPCLPVCEVMERIASQQIGRGFNVGVCNGRGAHWRIEGGAQERDLAMKYQEWASQRAFDFPYVGSVLSSIAADYKHQADWHDSEAKINKRLRQ